MLMNFKNGTLVLKWQRLFENNERLFWVLHTVGWAGFAVVYYIGSFLHEVRPIFLFIIILNSYAGWILTIPLRYIFRWARKQTVGRLLFTVLVSTYLVALVWAVVKNVNYWEIYKHGFRPEAWYMYFSNTIDSMIMIGCWAGLYFGIKNFEMLQREKQNALKASTMAHQAHLKMLRYQLNPHFLFNTLNAISTLILMKENDTAEAMVSRLSDFLRYSLDNDPIKKVPLGQEIKALRLYLEIEKVRFGERLEVTPQLQKSMLILDRLKAEGLRHVRSRRQGGGREGTSRRRKTSRPR